MTIDWSKAPVGTTGAMVAEFDGSTVERGDVDWIPSSITPKGQYEVGAGAWLYHEAPRPWNGEGLPPVGTVCVLSGPTATMNPIHPEWEGAEVKVYAHFTTDKGRHLAAYVSEDHMKGGVGVCHLFRPIRTPEQIEADQKKQEVQELMIILGSVESADYKDIAIAIQQANFRKQVSQ
ncbi:hypothetical protein [Pseudomonas syringae]|uniref:hypothetical protein n=2 Tax=Pseudomonas syringae TaxID=317 RepID=UPI001F2BFDA5|nr:hypothetical protein [Pseudomonas syringae]MCF5241962.1 hypothetical protein [Pseudomonas syringae]